METIFFEKQEGSLCAQHALNALLQSAYFTPVDLAAIARRLDESEARVLGLGDGAPSHNMDDSGYFSVQVLQEALRVWSLDLLPFMSPEAVLERDNPVCAVAFICNLREHWFTIRKLGFQWFNLNSLLAGPQIISQTYLNLFLAQLQAEGYSIFVVRGVPPPCRADAELRARPADPAAAATATPAAEQRHSTADADPELAEALRLSLAQAGGDDELAAGLEASRSDDEAADASLQRALDASAADADDEQLRLAISRSLEGHQGCSSDAPAASAHSPSSATDHAGAQQQAGADVPEASAADVRAKRAAFLAKLDQ